MPALGFRKSLNMFQRGVKHYAFKRPLVISFEVTGSCNADCQHCEKGGMIESEERLSPADYHDLYREIKAPVVQISGGEPLLRDDVVDIVEAVKQPNGLPHLIVVSNAALMTKEKYIALRNAGANQFSFSLDFPDERHDDFRRIPGLFNHLSKLIPELTALGYHDICFNTAITSGNAPYLVEIAEKTWEWGAGISFSAYSVMRTGNQDHFLNSKDELKILRAQVDELIRLKREGKAIRNPESILNKTYEFFAAGKVHNCSAGVRFFCVTPQGKFRSCAHHRREYDTPQEMAEVFSKKNKCGGCYVSIRSYSDKSFWDLFREYVLKGAGR